MDDPFLVRRRESVGERDADVEDLGQRHGACGHDPVEARAFDQLHRQKGGAVGLFHREQRDDVGMIQRGDRPRLALEADQPVGARGHVLGQDLERHLAVERRVFGEIDGAHAPLAEEAFDFVMPEALSGCEGQDPFPQRVGAAAGAADASFYREPLLRDASFDAAGPLVL